MIDIAVKLAICIVFGYAAIKYRVLDLAGTLFAVLIGGIIISLHGYGWFLLLLSFLIIGAVATKYKMNFKKPRLMEKPSRKATNVIANGAVPVIIAVLSIKHDLSMPYAAAIAVATADTLASEIGVLSDKAYMITNMKKVQPGVNGGVSILGEAAALAGSGTIALLAYLMIGLSPLDAVIVMILGIIGCNIDSLLGATFQGGVKGTTMTSNTLLSNSDVNLISITITALIAYIILILIT
ncbi:MAG: DUF92 domain-containing protein [Thermoplasmata archaeon]|nr:DUF92 domain-containing protein [Thermoplasmata archaeon]